MADRLYLIIEKKAVCKNCQAPVDPYSSIESNNIWVAHLMIMDGTNCPGRINAGQRFLDIQSIKDWANEMSELLGWPITETETK